MSINIFIKDQHKLLVVISLPFVERDVDGTYAAIHRHAEAHVKASLAYQPYTLPQYSLSVIRNNGLVPITNVADWSNAIDLAGEPQGIFCTRVDVEIKFHLDTPKLGFSGSSTTESNGDNTPSLTSDNTVSTDAMSEPTTLEEYQFHNYPPPVQTAVPTPSVATEFSNPFAITDDDAASTHSNITVASDLTASTPPSFAPFPKEMFQLFLTRPPHGNRSLAPLAGYLVQCGFTTIEQLLMSSDIVKRMEALGRRIDEGQRALLDYVLSKGRSR